jgi:crossover junction endodeoxyribonuclease RuvC
VTLLAQANSRRRHHATILGVDPGSITTGWGLIEVDGNRLRHIAHGIVAAPSTVGQAERLWRIHRGIDEVIKRFRPAAMSLEKVFFSRNAQSALKLGQARGMSMLAAAQNQITVFEYSATEIKVAAVGFGHATKDQIQRMVRALLGLNGALRADAADALAAAICHIHRQSYHSRVVGAVEAVARASWRDYPKIVTKR